MGRQSQGVLDQCATNTALLAARVDPDMLQRGLVASELEGAYADWIVTAHCDERLVHRKVLGRNREVAAPSCDPVARIAPARFRPDSEFREYPGILGTRGADLNF